MQTNGENAISIQEAMKLAQSPAGQELIRLLRNSGGADLQAAIEKAAAGDYSQAKSAIQSLMQDPQAQKLMKQMGGKP